MTDKRERDEHSGTQTTGHKWDGVKELDTPLPRWWLYIFYACIAAAVIIRGVNLSPTQIEDLICQDPRLAPHYELHVSRPGHLDELVIKVEAAPGSEAGAAASDDLALRIKGVIGVTARVEVVAPRSIARSQGKARRIFDTRPR